MRFLRNILRSSKFEDPQDKRTLEDKLASKEKSRDSQRVLRQDLVESEVGILGWLYNIVLI